MQSPYDDLLKRFCITPSKLLGGAGASCVEPFLSQDGKCVNATNGHICISVPVGQCQGTYAVNKIIDVEQMLVKLIRRPEPLTLDAEVLNTRIDKDTRTDLLETIECKYCSFGYVDWTDDNNNERQSECENCNGKGCHDVAQTAVSMRGVEFQFKYLELIFVTAIEFNKGMFNWVAGYHKGHHCLFEIADMRIALASLNIEHGLEKHFTLC